MPESENIFEQVSTLTRSIKEYVSLRISLFKVELTERWVKFISDIVVLILMISIGFFVLLFLSFAFAYWFAGMTGKWPLAFLLTAVFWILIGLILFLFRKPLIIDHIARITGEGFIDEEEESHVKDEQDDI